MPNSLHVAPGSPPQASAPLIQAWYTQAWPWLLMLGPFLVILAGGYTTWLAFTQQDALVVGDYYKQGKAINQDLRRDKIAASLQLNATLYYDAGQLAGNIQSGGKPLAGALILSLNHATLPEKDIHLPLVADAQGNFHVPLPALDLARWQVLIENEKRDWRLAANWIWPKHKKLRLQADHLPANPPQH
jgi:uncharacterized protein